ncbi:MAG TPA: hypothetical protein VD995_21090 [Azospirillum sp.]|nr:hypothetical protein [Azospirillum sp.]
MSPRLIETAIQAILESGARSESEHRLLARLCAVRDALCARPDCTTLCNAECRQTRRQNKLRF